MRFLCIDGRGRRISCGSVRIDDSHVTFTDLYATGNKRGVYPGGEGEGGGGREAESRKQTSVKTWRPVRSVRSMLTV